MPNVQTMIGILLTLKDQASSGLKSAGGNLADLGNSAAQAGAKFLVITESLKQVAGMVEQFMGRALDFDQAIQRSAIAMGMSGGEADKLKGKIKALADETLGGIYSSQQAADAFRAIADEGRGLEGTLSIVQDAMNLAAATGEDLAATTTNLEDILSAWNMTTEEAGRVSDVLLNTWRETGAPAGEVSSQLVQMGQIMSELGISFEEGSALIGTFKDVGVSGVTGLLSAFTQLTNSESKASKALEAMGVSALDAAGNLKTPTVLFTELKAAGMSATEALELFGIRGSSSMVAAVNNIETVGKVAKSSLGATGAAAEAAGQYAESSAAKQEKFNAAMEDMQLTLAEGLLPALTGFFDLIGPVLDTLTKYPEIIYAIVGGFIAFKVATWAQTVATTAGTAAIWANTVALMANPITWIVLAVMGLIIALVALAKNWDKVTKAAGDFAEGAKQKLGEFFGWVNNGLGSMKRKLEEAWEWMKRGWKNAMDGIGSALSNAGSSIKQWGEDRWNEAVKLGKKLIEEYLKTGKGMTEALKNGMSGLKDWFGGLWDRFKKWGAGLMDAFRRGLDEAKKKVTDFLGDLGKKFKDWLGFSTPPEKGPLHETPTWGRHFVETYAEGVMSGLPYLERRMNELSSAVVLTPSPGPSISSVRTAYDNRKTVQENHIYVSHADPEAIAMRVLELLSEALG